MEWDGTKEVQHDISENADPFHLLNLFVLHQNRRVRFTCYLLHIQLCPFD